MFKTRHFNLEEDVLHKMGVCHKTLKKIEAVIKGRKHLRASKVAADIIECLTYPHEKALLHLYLHALREQSQFCIQPIYTEHKKRDHTNTMLCLSTSPRSVWLFAVSVTAPFTHLRQRVSEMLSTAWNVPKRSKHLCRKTRRFCVDVNQARIATKMESHIPVLLHVIRTNNMLITTYAKNIFI